MAQIDDLKAAVVAANQAVSDELTRVAADLEALKADNPDVADAITSLNALATKVNAFDVHNPPPPPATT